MIVEKMICAFLGKSPTTDLKTSTLPNVIPHLLAIISHKKFNFIGI